MVAVVVVVAVLVETVIDSGVRWIDDGGNGVF